MKRTNRVAVSFARFNKDQLNCFAILVLLCLRNNPLFSKPTVSLADLGALQVAYQDAMSAATLGGSKDSAAFREARGALVTALRRIAGYIQSLGLTKESDVLSSGFDLAVWNTRQTPLTMPVLVRLDNSVSTQLTLKLRAVSNARAYEVQFSADGGQTWQETGRLSEYAGDCAGRPHAGRGVCDAGSCHWRLDALQRLEQPHFLHGHLGGTSTTYMQSPERARM
jgi:hypothetical protein